MSGLIGRLLRLRLVACLLLGAGLWLRRLGLLARRLRLRFARRLLFTGLCTGSLLAGLLVLASLARFGLGRALGRVLARLLLARRTLARLVFPGLFARRLSRFFLARCAGLPVRLLLIGRLLFAGRRCVAAGLFFASGLFVAAGLNFWFRLLLS